MRADVTATKLAAKLAPGDLIDAHGDPKTKPLSIYHLLIVLISIYLKLSV